MVAPSPKAGDRLRKRGEFVRVQQQGRKWRGRLLLMMVAGNDAPGPRIGLTVSRKVGNAVVRNRVKRRLRALWREEPTVTQEARDIVIVALPSAATAPYATLRREFLWLLDKAVSRASRAC